MNLQCKHMLSPSSLRLKNNWGTYQKLSRKIWKSTSCIGISLLNMTLFASCRVGISSFVSLTFLGWAIYFFPSILSLPRHHGHWSHGSKSYQTSSFVTDLFKSCPSPVTLTFVSLYCPKSFFMFLSHVDFVGNIMALLWQGHFRRLQLIILEVDRETPFQHLRACMP